MIDEGAFSLKELESRQQAAWSEALRYLFAQSPFYREHFRRAGLSPSDSIPLSDLARIPPIDSAILADNADAFLCVPPHRIVDIVTTSGSTGRPLVWKLTESDLERLASNEQLSFACAGFTPQDTVLLAVAMDRCFIAGMAYFLGLRRMGCAIVRTGPSTHTLTLDMLRRVPATAIVGVPSFLALLTDKAAVTKLNLAELGVRKTVCIGEPVRHQDFTLNPAGQLLAQRFHARVYSTYGMTEIASSLCECDAGRGGHLHPDWLFLEALDEAGRAVPDGQVGELTATTFGVEAMPLVRYRTGDYAAIYREPCPCGRITLRIGPIVGRRNQKLKIKGATLFPSTLKSVLDSTPGISAYALIARSAGPATDCVEVKVACAENPDRILAELRERFQGEAKVAPQVAVASPAEIEALQMPEGARKRRYFVDLRD